MTRTQPPLYPTPSLPYPFFHYASAVPCTHLCPFAFLLPLAFSVARAQKVLEALKYIYLPLPPSLSASLSLAANRRRNVASAVATIVAIIATALKHLRPAPCNQKDFVALVPLLLSSALSAHFAALAA